jgi:hypothetical protein
MTADAFESSGAGVKLIRAIFYLTVLESPGSGTRLRMAVPLSRSL